MLGFGKQQVMTLDELNAYRVAYGNPLMKKEIFTALVVPFMVSFFAVMILTYYWWLALMGGIIGGAYGYFVLMPMSIQRVYQQQALLQRNRFVNNMTQLLTNPGETPITALKWCAQGIVAKGEFKEDLDKLIADLMDADATKVKEAFASMSNKYKSDFVFKLYIDNLVTAMLEGRTDIGKIKELKTWHNDIIEQTNIFVKNKIGYVHQYKITTYYSVVIIGILTFAMGFESYLRYYAHSPIGWISSAIVIGASAYFFHSFQKKLADDEVMEVKIWKK